MAEEAGQGIAGTVDGRHVALGRSEWTGVNGAPPWVKTVRRRSRLDGVLTVFVAIDHRPAGALLLEDRIRPDARATIRALRQGGIKRIVLATGDRAEVADAIGAITGVDEVIAGLTPAGNLDVVRREQRHGPVIMTGDGINDAPALALADVGVAMGARGSTASSEAADAVLTVDRLGRLGDVAAIGRLTRRIALQSALDGMGMSLAAMGVAAAGLLPAVWGALLQEAIDVAVIVNALRALRPAAAGPRLAVGDAALTKRFRDEHEMIRAGLNQVRAAAEASGGSSSARPDPAAVAPGVTVSRVQTADGSVVTVAVFHGPVQFVLHNGSRDPGSRYSGLLHAGPVITGAERQRLLAAFNSGFLLSSHSGGYEQEGHVIRGLRTGLGTVVIDRSGHARVGVWGAGLPVPGEAVYSARQNLRPLLIDGQPAANVALWHQWGAHWPTPSTSPAAPSARTAPATYSTPRACPRSPPTWPAH